MLAPNCLSLIACAVLSYCVLYLLRFRGFVFFSVGVAVVRSRPFEIDPQRQVPIPNSHHQTASVPCKQGHIITANKSMDIILFCIIDLKIKL